MSETPIMLEPGLLVTLSTRVEGGVKYKRTDLPPDEVGPVVDGDTGEEMEDHREVSRWETTKVVTDADEFKEANKVRTKCRALITGACITTPFGFMICPSDQEEVLDQRITEAKAMAALFNQSAVHSRIRITPMRGEITKTKEEATSAVQQQVGVLISDLQRAISAGEVGSIRELSSKLTQMGKLVEKKSAARGALDRAVAAARKIARTVKRAADAGEQIAAVIEASNTSPISAARFVFSDSPGEAGRPVTADDLLDDDDTPALEALPGVAVGRFAGMEVEEDADEEPEPVQPSPPTVHMLGRGPGEEAATAEALPLAAEIVGELEAALAEFGTYSFDDKGAYEVMDLGSIQARLGALESDQAAAVLEAVSRHSDRADTLVSTLVENMVEDAGDDDRVKTIIAASPYLGSQPWSPVFDEPAGAAEGKTFKLTNAADLFGGQKGGAQ